ncbi:MAG: M28 family metallopeptidase [Peptococcaceae bacterium]|nr:M28 family metallopeptidase [Peptococcaceae bacterium]
MKINKTQKTILNLSLIVITLAIGIILGIWQMKPPRVDEASLQYPAYQRMMENIQRMAQNPHRSGSDEIRIVRAQLLAEIEAMGLTPIVEDAPYTASEIADAEMRFHNTTRDEWWEQNRGWIETYCDIYSLDDWFARKAGEDGILELQNILVKLDASETERGVMFVSHYDSVDTGPGAADDMLGVCVMLEAMRAQGQNNGLKNDIYFLFTDGEEMAMLGAWKFVKAHPELKDKIDMVINIEAGGTRGGLVLFETSLKAYPLLETVKKSGAKPIGFSWAAAVYGMMPNKDSDLTPFIGEGYKGINLAAAEGMEHYHMPTDSYENLNSSTAWHYIQTILALADYAAHNSLDELRESPSEAVYFPFLPGVMVLMNALMSHILCIAACVLALVFGAVQEKRGQLKVTLSVVLMGVLVLLTAGSLMLFPAGSYLFSIPLFLIVITKFLKKWTIVHYVVWMISGVMVLLLWVPALFLLWGSMVQPMMM